MTSGRSDAPSGNPSPTEPAAPSRPRGHREPFAEFSLAQTGHQADPSPPPRQRRRGAPAVERIAGWSAVHRKTAVIGWLVLVAAAFIGGQLLPASNVQSYDPGQSGQAERTLVRLNVTSPPAESVLVQARGPGATFATDPAMRQAVRQLTAALAGLPHAATGIRSPLGRSGANLVSADGRSVLVTFTLPGNSDNDDQAVAPAMAAVAAVAASHPGLIVAEAGDASTDRVANAV